MLSTDIAYRSRVMSAEQAVALIPSQAKVVMGLGVSQPPALLGAMADRARAGNLTQVRLYYLLSSPTAGQTVLNYDLRNRIRPISLFHGANERALDARAAAEGQPLVDLLPTAFSQVPRLLCDRLGADTLVTTVSPMDENGCFSFGTNTDYALAMSRTAERVILEVNPNMPRVHGDCTVHVSDVTAIVENEAPLWEIAAVPIRKEDAAIGLIIAGLIQNGACLQMGIGALPDAVCAALRGHSDLGIHTELMTPGLAGLIKAGVVNNSRKSINTGKSVFTFAMGDQALYEFLNDNPMLEAHPVDYVNDPAIIARNDRTVSVNATLQVDLQGACNSEFMADRQYSAAGGQLDFVRGATASHKGQSFIACHSTAAKGKISRIVPRLTGPVTTPRNDTNIIVTEFGWVDLKRLTLAERGTALIGIAHPDFREDLEKSLHGSSLA